ncbi:LysR family transcriptional regulator [Baekduia alba]|uniref:LysR family transcriptional regulator n=1 Tax=Baekduia alba TaxID=2997333 RepID=UPI00234203EF|nr:LysR family transcriptional regulator [Baekduia alba]
MAAQGASVMAPPALGGVEPRHLATLAAVAQEGSFKVAAERLGYALSAVSQQVTQLERALGAPVVVRTPGQGLELTEVGALVARHARGILAQLDAAGADLRGEAGALRVGIHDRAVMDAIPRAIALLAARAPDVALTVRDNDRSPEARADAVRRGELDAALDDLPLPDGPFASAEVLRDPIVLVVAPDSPLAEQRELDSLDELRDVALVADVGWPMLPLVEDQLRAAGVRPRITMRSRLATGLLPLVAAGLGSALVPRTAVDEHRAGVVVVGLGDLLPPRRVAVYWHRDRRRVPALRAFREALCAAVRTSAETPR